MKTVRALLKALFGRTDRRSNATNSEDAGIEAAVSPSQKPPPARPDLTVPTSITHAETIAKAPERVVSPEMQARTRGVDPFQVMAHSQKRADDLARMHGRILDGEEPATSISRLTTGKEEVLFVGDRKSDLEWHRDRQSKQNASLEYNVWSSMLSSVPLDMDLEAGGEKAIMCRAIEKVLNHASLEPPLWELCYDSQGSLSSIWLNDDNLLPDVAFLKAIVAYERLGAGYMGWLSSGNYEVVGLPSEEGGGSLVQFEYARSSTLGQRSGTGAGQSPPEMGETVGNALHVEGDEKHDPFQVLCKQLVDVVQEAHDCAIANGYPPVANYPQLARIRQLGEQIYTIAGFDGMQQACIILQEECHTRDGGGKSWPAEKAWEGIGGWLP